MTGDTADVRLVVAQERLEVALAAFDRLCVSLDEAPLSAREMLADFLEAVLDRTRATRARADLRLVGKLD